MAFERFTETGRGFEPKVSIWKKGQISFNRGAINRFNISDYVYAILFFDKETNRIGVKFTNDDKEQGAMKMNHREAMVIVAAKIFFDCYNIDYSETKKYDIQFNEQAGMHVIQLEPDEEQLCG